jgi:hypothetical protein
MAFVILACVSWAVLAITRSGGDESPPELSQSEGVRAHYIEQPGIPLPEGPPHVIGFVLGLFVFFIGWALWQ